MRSANEFPEEKCNISVPSYFTLVLLQILQVHSIEHVFHGRIQIFSTWVVIVLSYMLT